ncbi:unnamed protein product, partial [Cylindrotheca closterium]
MRQLQTCMELILLAGLYSHQADAFGTGLKASPPRSATLFPSTRQNVESSSNFARPIDRIFALQSSAIDPDDGEAIFKAVDDSSMGKKESSTKRLLWACMVLMFAQFSSNF